MKAAIHKRVFSVLLVLVMLCSLLPTAALAEEVSEDGDVSDTQTCTCTALCTEDEQDGDCAVCAEGYTACGYEDESQQDEPSEELTAEEQLAEMIAALPDPSDIDPEDEEQVEEVYHQISAIYDFAEENGLDVEDNDTINAVIEAAWPSETTDDTVSSITSAGGSLAEGSYTLSGDVTLTTANLTIPADTTVTIDLNNYTLTGNGSGSVITVNGTLTIKDSGTSGKITNGNSGETESIYGGGVRVAGGSLTLAGGAISGNTSKNGGGVYITSNGTFTMTGGEISENTCVISGSSSTYPYGSGAGVFVDSGSFTMSGGAIKNNVFGSQGGGVFVSAGASFVMNNGEISGNTGSQGGGVLVNGTFTMSGGGISNNTVTIPESVKTVFAGTTLRGGGVLLNSRGAVFNFNGGTISGNSAVSASNKDDTSVAAFAGGVCVSTNTNMYVSGSPVVSGNTVDTTSSSNIWLATGNVLTLSGYVTSPADLPVTLESISGRVTDCGSYTMASGVVSSENDELTVQVRDGDTYFTKTVSVDDAVCSSTISGETVYYETLAAALADLPTDDNTITLLKSIDADTTATLPSGKAQLTTNVSDGVTITWKGGSGNCFIVPAQSELTLSGAITIQADSSAETAPKSAFSVAGILNIGETDASGESPKITGFDVKNSSPNNGGAVNISAGGTLNLYSGCLNDNEGTTGGAIYATGESTKVNLYGGTINGNKATDGGGVAVTGSAALTISGTVISGNEASNNGGGIYLNNASATMTAGTVGGTSATDGLNTAIRGGGVYIDNANSVFNMTGGSIDYNTVANTTGGAQGGGVHINNGTFTLSGSGSISNNKIENGNAANGGGIYMNTGTLNVQGGTVASNSVKRTDGSEGGYGGGIYANKGTFNMTAGQVNKNTSYRGGGLYLADSGLTATISGGSISENNATNEITNKENWGGGVYVANASLGVTGGDINNNEATSKGGGIFVATSGTLTLSDGTICKNEAAQGGGIYTYGTAQISGDPVVYENTSDGSKANNVYLQDGKTLTLTDALTSGANIGVTMATTTAGTTVAQGATGDSSYAVTEDDAAYFVYDDSTKDLLIQKDSTESKLILAAKDASAKYYKVTLELSDHVTANKALTTEVKSTDDYEVTFTVEDGYDISVKIEDEEQTLEDGKLTLSNLDGDKTITVTETAKSIVVNPTSGEVNGTYGTALTYQIDVSASYATTRSSIIQSFALADDNSLPAGLTLSSAGLISGTPTEVGDWENGKAVSVVVTANNGTTATITLTVKIAKADVSNTAKADVHHTYGTTYDVSNLFTIDDNAGTATYVVATDTDSADEGEATLGTDGTTLTITKAGNIAITLTTAETNTHAAGQAVTATLCVDKATLTITADNQTVYVGGTLPEYTYTVSGLVGDDTEAVITTAPTMTCSAQDANTEGDYTITPSDAYAGDNYDITYESGTLTVATTDDDEDPETHVAEPEVDVGAIGDAYREAVTTVAQTVTSNDALKAGAAEVASALTTETKNSLLNKYDLTVGEGETLSLYVQAYLDIKATNVGTDDSKNINSITLNITPKVQIVASTATKAADIVLDRSGGETVNAKVIQDATDLTITSSAQISVKLSPEAFKGQTVYIEHEASSGTYYYHAKADSDGKVEFTSTHGFSPFTFSLSNGAVAEVDGIGYDSLQAALDASSDGDTISIVDDSGTTSYTASTTETKTVSVTNNTGSTITVKINSTSKSISDGDTKSFDTSASSSSTSSGGGSGSSSYTISVDSARHGTVTASATRATKGTTVTITVSPDDGYELDELTVTNSSGTELTLTKKSDTKYTFTMPASKVTVEASFVEIEEEPDEGLSFVDVAESAYYYDAVEWAVAEGITSGTSSTTFSPDAACTRAQAVTFLWRAAGSPEPETTNNPFTDVSTSAYYYEAVLWAVENGITAGTSSTTFSPDNTCTRGQIVTFLYRAVGTSVTESNPFTDVADSAYYADAVKWAVAEGVTSGTSATTFSPDQACTRAQIVTFLFRAYN